MLVNIDRHALGPVNLVVRLADQLPFDPVTWLVVGHATPTVGFEPILDCHLRLCAFDQ